ncbi:MAG: PAS domain S-box protein [Endomicrobium sp.]|jgi:PAS domain S-box-containing protein|nr:PAS domain S-box protein [Endomicrobium sp.]
METCLNIILNYDYAVFFLAWSFLLLSLSFCFAWKYKLGNLSYLWIMLFCAFIAASKFMEVFSYGSVFTESGLHIVHAALEYLAFLSLYMCSVIPRAGLKTKSFIKLSLVPFAIMPFAVSFFAGFHYFEAVSFVFLWIPSTAVLLSDLFRVSKIPPGYKHITVIFAFAAVYAAGFLVLETLRVFHCPMSDPHIAVHAVAALAVFFIAAMSFRHFKFLYEQQIRIYDFMPFYWKHIPLASIVFVILVSGLSVSFYAEGRVKKEVARDADNIISGLSETLSARISKTEQISEALAKSVFLKEAVSHSFSGDKNSVDEILEEQRNTFKVAAIFVLDENGDAVYASENGYGERFQTVNLKNSLFFSEAQANGTARLFTKNVPGEPGESYYAAAKINGSGGIAVVKNSIDNYAEMLLMYENVYIIDKNGTILFSNDSEAGLKNLRLFYEPAGKTEKRKENPNELFNGDTVILKNKLFHVSKKFINGDFWSVVYFTPLDSARHACFLVMLGVSVFIVIVLLLFLIVNQSNRLMALLRRQNAILDSVRSVAILSADVNGKISMWGQGAADLSGYSAEEITGKEFKDVLFDKEGVSVSFDDAIERRGFVFNNFTFKKKDGSMAEILLNVVPQFSAAGKLIGYIFSAVDITYMKNVETELEQQIKFLQILIDSIPAAVFYKDVHMNVVGCNKAFEEITGLSKEEIIGKKFENIYSGRETVEMSEKTDKEVIKNMSAISFETVFKSRGASVPPKTLLFYKSAYKKLNGEIGGIIGVIIDVTKERAVQKERDRLKSSLMQQSKLAALGELAGGIAHELNNPLSIILGYAQVLMKNAGFDDETRKGVKNVYDAAVRSRGIISNMLEFSRTDSSKMQDVNVNKIVESSLLIVEKDLKKAGIETEKNFAEKDSLVSANPVQIQQVLINIILNARDAMPDGGKITIDSYVKNGKYCLSISDTGTGIAKENLDKIFDPFFTTKEEGKGTGLGLSISYGIITAHKGTINVKSVSGKGSVFTVKLPLAKNNASQ